MAAGTDSESGRGDGVEMGAVTKHSPLDETYDSLVNQLDAGVDPPGVLVARETRGQRIVGLIICLIVGPVAVAGAFATARLAAEEPRIFLFCAGGALFLGASACLLLYQIAFGSYFYIAMTDRELIKRMGPGKRRAVPLSNVTDFAVVPGKLFARLRSGKRLLLMKNVYAPESLSDLRSKLSLWMQAPGTERGRLMKLVDVTAILRRMRTANRLLLSGLATGFMCVTAMLPAIAFPNFTGLGTVIAIFALAACLVQVFVGVVWRFQAVSAKQRLLEGS